jgi:hypothetical protein
MFHNPFYACYTTNDTDVTLSWKNKVFSTISCVDY